MVKGRRGDSHSSPSHWDSLGGSHPPRLRIVESRVTQVGTTNIYPCDRGIFPSPTGPGSQRWTRRWNDLTATGVTIFYPLWAPRIGSADQLIGVVSTFTLRACPGLLVQLRPRPPLPLRTSLTPTRLSFDDPTALKTFLFTHGYAPFRRLGAGLSKPGTLRPQKGRRHRRTRQGPKK